MNLSQLRQRVKELIHKVPTTPSDDTGRPTNAEINQAINESRWLTYNDIANMFPQRFGASTTVAYPGGSTKVALPSAAQSTQMFYVYGTYGSDIYQMVMDPLIVAEWINFAEEGNPRHYTIVGNDIYLRPRPTSDLTLTLFHLPTLAALSLDADTPSEIPAMFHHIYAYRGAAIIRKMNEDPAGGLIDEYNQQLEQINRFYTKLVPDNQVHETARAEWWLGL